MCRGPLCSGGTGGHASLSLSLGVRTEHHAPHAILCARESVNSEWGCVVSPQHARGRRRNFPPISDTVNSYSVAAWDFRPPGWGAIVVGTFAMAMVFRKNI
jgi:hypothetical protein